MEHEEKNTIGNLKGASYNPRKITGPQLERLQKSLEEFGDLSGIVFNSQTGNLVSGHQRCKLIPKKSEIIIVNKYDPPTKTGTVAEGHVVKNGEKFVYREVSWPTQKEKLANLSANAQGGEWEEGALGALLRDCASDTSFNIELTGFDKKDIVDIIGEDVLLAKLKPEMLQKMSDDLHKSFDQFEQIKEKTHSDKNEQEFYIVVLFKTVEENYEFCEKLGLPMERYQDGMPFLEKLRKLKHGIIEI